MHDPVSELAQEWLVRAEHDHLIDLCAPLDRAFEQFRAELDELTPYAVEFRYPDALPLVPLELARAAVGTASRVYAFVLARLKQG